jgi:hypothetical protein
MRKEWKPHFGSGLLFLLGRKGEAMAESTILICDVDGTRPAVATITIKVGRANWTKDLCQIHLDEALASARKPRPGRRAGTLAAPSTTARGKRRGRPPGSKSKSSGNGRRRPRTAKATAASS